MYVNKQDHSSQNTCQGLNYSRIYRIDNSFILNIPCMEFGAAKFFKYSIIFYNSIPCDTIGRPN